MPQQMSDKDLKEALKGLTIPPQPQILVDIQLEQLSPNPDLKQIAKLISKDPGLAGTMLKIVNSSFFGLNKTVTDIRQAVNMLGLNLVFNILTGISIRGALSDTHIVALTRFWDSAMDLAEACMLLARHFKLRKADEAYLLGLFHNCGIPLLLTRFPDYMTILQASYAQSELPLVEIEWESIKSHHAVIGYYIARSWKLPVALCQIINAHHELNDFFANITAETAAERREMEQLMCVLKLAEHLVGLPMALAQQQRDVEWIRHGHDIMDRMNLTEDDLDELKADLKDVIH